jgi:hypothetical protein
MQEEDYRVIVLAGGGPVQCLEQDIALVRDEV